MKCPICLLNLSQTLSRTMGGLRGCPKCFGSFCSASIIRVPIKLEAPSVGILSCPACKVMMNRGAVYHSKLTLDMCPKCAGVWFDAFEIDKLKEVSGQKRVLGTAGRRAVEFVQTSRENLPWKRIGFFLLAFILYGVLLTYDLRGFLLDVLIPATMQWPKGFNLEGTAETILTHIKSFLWILMTVLSVSILIDFLNKIFPPQDSSSSLKTLNEWEKQEGFVVKSLVEDDFVLTTEIVSGFVDGVDKEHLVDCLETNNVPAQWLVAYRDARCPTYLFIVLFVLIFTTMEIELPVLGIGANVLLGLLVGALFSLFIATPVFSSVNERSRRKLIQRWMAGDFDHED